MEILPFFWPTKVLILDDDADFLEELAQLLGNKGDFIFTTDPKEAYDLITKQQLLYNWYIKSRNLHEYGRETYDVDYKLIHTVLYEPKRYDIISTVVVDYHMPKISGLEFCNSLSYEYGIKKILLTGNMSYQNAIENLNTQSINKFLDKTSLNFDVINEAIRDEKYNFFKNHTALINKCIKYNNIAHFIYSTEFTEYFKSIENNYCIKEYYLLNELGWYLMIDNSNNNYGLFIFSAEEIEEMYNEACLNGATKSICKALKAKEKALCYYNPLSSNWPKTDEWEKYICKIQKISIGGSNGKTFYTSIVKDILDLSLEI